MRETLPIPQPSSSPDIALECAKPSRNALHLNQLQNIMQTRQYFITNQVTTVSAVSDKQIGNTTAVKKTLHRLYVFAVKNCDHLAVSDAASPVRTVRFLRERERGVVVFQPTLFRAGRGAWKMLPTILLTPPGAPLFRARVCVSGRRQDRSGSKRLGCSKSDSENVTEVFSAVPAPLHRGSVSICGRLTL